MGLLLDTTAYSALLRNNQTVVGIIAGAQMLALPLMVIGELRYGFLGGGRPDENEIKLERFLAQPDTSVILPTIQTTSHFARLNLICKKPAECCPIMTCGSPLWLKKMT